MAEDQVRRPDDGRHARAWLKPWAIAAMACAGSYLLVQTLGSGRLRSEFLGASLAVGIIGGLLLFAFRALRGPLWLRWLGIFCVNWLFAAYAISFLAV
jgi:Na+(H+)/acetate symporter ActP